MKYCCIEFCRIFHVDDTAGALDNNLLDPVNTCLQQSTDFVTMRVSVQCNVEDIRLHENAYGPALTFLDSLGETQLSS
jgi:hypothetical protein